MSNRLLDLLAALSMGFVGSCSTAPKLAQDTLTAQTAEKWLNQYCSPEIHESAIAGQMIVRADTQEFKGQFPASVALDKSGQFVLEVTNILGGTVGQISGNSDGLSVQSTSKPKYNRTGIQFYMGIPAQVLVQLIRGELPCPSPGNWRKVTAQGAIVSLDTGVQSWTFERVQSEGRNVPGKVSIDPQKIQLTVEEWDLNQNYAKKVRVVTEAGTLRWTWKSRDSRE